MMLKTSIIPKLNLRNRSDADLNDYAAFVLNQLTLHAADFPGLKPNQATLNTVLVNYSSALVLCRAGGKLSTMLKNDCRRKLENTLIYMAANCNAIANGNRSRYLLSGFEIRGKRSAAGLLPAPTQFNLEVSRIEGILIAKFKTVKNSKSYELRFGPFDTDPADWNNFMIMTSGRSNFITDLESGKRYSARVCAVGAGGKQGEWSAIVTQKVY